jgi:hypothetical protein
MHFHRSLALILVLSSSISVAEANSPNPKWAKTMQGLYATLSELLSDVASDERFSAPSNQARIAQNTQKLSKLSHGLKGPNAGSPDLDPSIKMIGELFADETSRAAEAFKAGHKGYARELIRGMTSYCIACHTRTDSGPKFSELSLNPASGTLKTAELGSFYAATRQYDKALSEFEKQIGKAGAARKRPIEWTNAVRNALAIAVRVKRDPAKALAIVDETLSTKNVPFSARKDALAWKKSLEEWKKESKSERMSEEQLHSEAARLLMAAHTLQKYPVDRSADILYLRASATAHDLLNKNPAGKYTAEAYFMAGLTYDVLRPYRLGELHELYYEGCIKKSPHTLLSESCYRHLEQSVYEGFTGSAGTDIPEDVQEKLQKLQAAASAENKNGKLH